MKSKILLGLGGAVLLSGLAAPLVAQDEDAIARIMDEGLNHSELPERASELLDRIGPRLTNSPGMRKAEDWAVAEFRDLGLTNVHKEGFTFGRGWEMVSTEVRMVTPRPLELTAIPMTWTPDTNGTIQAEIVVAPMNDKEHFEAYRGQLAGKIVLVSKPGTGSEQTTVPFRRLDAGDISARDVIEIPHYDPHGTEKRLENVDYAMERDAFLKSEGALAIVSISRRDGKLLHGTGYTFQTGNTPSLPHFELAAEDYRRLARLAKTGPAPVVALTSQVQWYDDNPEAYNILADIEGSDPKAGYVMAGAHFDSWAAGDGAVDNGSGSLVLFEAARILKAIGAKPKRTIRFALWNAEEQGLLGSLAYIRSHIATRAGDDVPPSLGTYYAWGDRWPIEKKPGFSELKAYFNMDNGSGKFRGIHAENNVAAEPLLRKWLVPFHDLGATSVVSGETGATDHYFLQTIGLPGFQFIQDPLDYMARLHHTNIDTYDHLKMDDLRQASVIMAGMLLQAANDEKTLPVEPLPRQPVDSDPFKYTYPDED